MKEQAHRGLKVRANVQKLSTKSNTHTNILDSKRMYAMKITKKHTQLEDTISAVGYITSDLDDNPQEPIKLLEINSASSASGFFPVTFGPTDSTPFKRTLVELSPKEAKELEKGTLAGWPSNWKIEQWLFRKKTSSSKYRKQ